jgi:hypothetical protein
VELEGVLLIVQREGRLLLRRRDDGESRMAGFWDLPTPEELPKARLGEPVGTFRHTITHHHYTWTVRFAHGGRGPGAGDRGQVFGWFEVAELPGIPLCTTARKGLRLAGIEWNENGK